MQRITATLLASLAALSCLSALPAEASEAHQRVYCKRALKDRLRDPSSLKIPWGGIVAGGDVVRISYRARNGFGGMNSSTFYCEFDGKTLIRTVNN